MCVSGVAWKSRVSMWCCVKAATRTLWFLKTCPCDASSSPMMRFRRVDFPTPFLPTTATLESMSRPKFSSRKMGPAAPG